MVRYPFICTHPLSTLLQPEPVNPCDSHHMPCEVRWRVRDGVSVFYYTLIKGTQRYTLRQWWLEFGNLFAGRNQASLEIHLELVITCNWRYSKRPYSSEPTDELRHCDWASWQIHLEALMEGVWTGGSTGSMDGAPGAENVLVSLLTCTQGNVTRWIYLWALMESWLMAVNGIGSQVGSWSDIEGSTRNHQNLVQTSNLGWMLYSVEVQHCTSLYSV